jgi:type VI secretion system protein ImpA
MASPVVLDLERLTAPAAADNPVGIDLRSDTSPASIYYQVKDVRSQARAAERQALLSGDGANGDADWRPILSIAPEVLADSSKDLEIVAYLIEALVREHGFAGLRDGFRLARELVEKYGDQIYPLPDEDGVETRVAPLTGLNGEGAEGTLIAPILGVPITDHTSVGRYTTAQYQQAVELERMPAEVKERRLAQGSVDVGTILQAVGETTGPFFRDLLDDLQAATDEFATMSSVLDAKYGHAAPPTSNIRQALDACRETVEQLARDKLAVLAEETAEAEVAAADGTPAAAGASGAAGEIRTRDDAFRTILKVADFFRRTEPHSPISYALERLVRWGRLPLPDLLRELIADQSSVEQMFRLVGIERPKSEE